MSRRIQLLEGFRHPDAGGGGACDTGVGRGSVQDSKSSAWASTVALGGFLVGFDATVISGPCRSFATILVSAETAAVSNSAGP